MHWQLSEEQELFAASLREWIDAKFPTDKVRELTAHRSSDGFGGALISEGWWGVGYPEAIGGQGGGVLELALAAREFGRAAVPDARWLAGAIVAPLLTDAERGAQVSGEVAHVLAVRVDRVPDSTATTRTPLTGRIPHVLAARDAGVFLVPTMGPDGPVLARVDAAKVQIDDDDLLDRSRATATVTLADAPPGATTDLPAAALERVSALAGVLVAADALGAAERMLDLAVDYSKQRKQFGQLIGSFQAVKHAAAQMLVTVEAAYSSVLYAAAAIDADLPDAPTIAAVAKAQVTKTVADLADSALTVHGAIGYTWEHDLHLFYKRAKLDRVLFGTPAAWNERIAHVLLDQTG
ncbi:acyl-CoA/acyl-ACP dehydrogenase [Gordonia sp. TBRC 11910]|uniref:Acyl-CoA/acyl-ACP dehydrogenase n=1 Tax=Gordonia asplenii TaxID=2725283 RepID=A0A848KTK5_9ACTN|nr:acyl-CoA dehydrogenase family protein [Gordonia asplenii]NMO02264.1 acyl-CoA/acyl-ACP dehydrogenase [Gordonia asplenii]